MAAPVITKAQAAMSALSNSNQQHQAEHKADMRYHIGHTFTPKKLSLCQHVGK